MQVSLIALRPQYAIHSVVTIAKATANFRRRSGIILISLNYRQLQFHLALFFCNHLPRPDDNYRCNVVPFAATGQLGAVAMDCDRVVFHGDAPQLPYGAPIVAYTQRHSGQQVLPAQVSVAIEWR